MYKEILEYAKKENIQPEYDFENKKIHWLISLDKNGKMSSKSIPNEEEVIKNGKTFKKIKVMSVPYTDPNRISAPKKPEYYFLIGKAEVLLGTNTKKSCVDKLNFVKNLLLQIKDNENALALYNFLNDPDEITKVLSDLKEQKMKEEDWITFIINGKILLKDPNLLDFYRTYRKDNATNNVSLRKCHITNTLTECVDKFTKIASLPKLGPVDLTGLCKKTEAYMHYGISDLTVGKEADNLIKLGLYDLCSKGTYVEGIVYIGWAKEKSDSMLGLDLLNYIDEDAVKKLITSSLKGEEYDSIDSNQYYLFGLTTRAGRLLVVEKHVISINKLQRNLKEWFLKMGDESFSIKQLTTSLESESDGVGAKRHIQKNYYRRLLRSSLLNEPIPKNIISKALDLEIVAKLKDSTPNKAREALLRLAVSSSDKSSIAYEVGKLIGKYANLHRYAMHSIGNTGNNRVESVLKGIVNRPNYNYTQLKKHFNKLEYFYTKKIDQKSGSNLGTKMYKEINDTNINIPDRFYSLDDKICFMIAFSEITK